MVDGANPAGTLEAPQVDEIMEQTPDTTQGQEQGTSGQTETPAKADKGGETASAPAQPAAQQPQQPDIESLLQNAEIRKALLEHPELRREIDHRVRSTRQADIEAIVQQRVEQLRRDWEAQQRHAAEKQRILNADPLDLAEEYKQKFLAEEQQRAVETVARQLAREREIESIRKLQAETLAAIGELNKEFGLTPEEMEKLHPVNYDSWTAYFKGVSSVLASKQAQKLLKEKLPVEVEAKVQERLGVQQIDNAPKIPSTPSGAKAVYGNVNEINLAFLNGEFGDPHSDAAIKRWEEELKRIGASP